mgnify:CR=1 FL=1
MNNNVYLKLENVKKSLANFELDNVSFSLPKGYIMGLLVQMVLEKPPQLNSF